MIHKNAHVFLIEVSPAVLGAFSRDSQRYAALALTEHGVQLRLEAKVREVQADGVLLSDGSRIPTETAIWAAGVKPASYEASPGLPMSRSGRIDVQPDLTVAGFQRVYAIGDLADARNHAGKPLPQLAAVAQQEGKCCAENIIASVDGKNAQPFSYRDRGILAMIGRNAAIAELAATHHEIVGPVAFHDLARRSRRLVDHGSRQIRNSRRMGMGLLRRSTRWPANRPLNSNSQTALTTV